MRDVVCTQKIRPPASERWLNHPVGFLSLNQREIEENSMDVSIQILRPIVNRLCEELWIEDPSCRLNSLNIKRQLKKQLELLENDRSNINIESQQQSTQNDGPWTA